MLICLNGFTVVGLVLDIRADWGREGVGASLTLISLLAFYLVFGYLFRYHISGWAFVLFASPAFLFLFHWLLFREGQQRFAFRPKSNLRSRWISIGRRGWVCGLL